MERYQSVLLIIAIAVGLLVGQFAWIAERAALAIVPLLVLMLYGVFLQVPLKHLGRAFQSVRFTGTSLAVNFLWSPVLAWGLGALFLSHAPELRVGLIMLMVTPCTDWYLVFTSISRGNVALGTALLPWNLLLQLVLLPVYLLLLGGMLVEIDIAILLQSVLFVLAVPFVAAYFTRRLIEHVRDEVWIEGRLLPKVALGQPILLSLAIAAMFASQGSVLLQGPELVVGLLAPLILFFAINFVIGQTLGRMLRFSYDEVVSLTFTTLARNSPIALAIAVSAFPERPVIALALVIGALIELPVLAVVSRSLLSLRGRAAWSGIKS